MKKKRRLLQSDLLWAGAALLLIIMQFWWLPGEDGSAGDSYSNTIDGKLGLYRTLTQLCGKVERDVTRVVPQDSSATMLLISPDRYPTDAEQQELYSFVASGGNLLFAPRWLPPEGLVVAPDEDQGANEVKIPSLNIRISPRSWLEHTFGSAPPGATPPATSTGNAPADSTSTPSDGSASNGTTTSPSGTDVPAPQSATEESSGDGTAPSNATPNGVTPSGTVPDPSKADALNEDQKPGTDVSVQGTIVSGPVEIRTSGRLDIPDHLSPEVLLSSSSGDVEAATWNIGLGRVVVCSTADIFSNRSMLLSPERRLAVRLVERAASGSEDDELLADSTVVIAEYFNASDAWQNTGILFSPAMRIGSLQLLLITVLSIWMAFHRFGPAQDVMTSQRRSLTESAEAVGNLQYRLRDGGDVVKGYLEYIRSQLRRRYGSLLRLEQPDQIASRANMTVAEVKEQLTEAHRLAKTSGLSASQSATMLRWLSGLQQRLSGKREP